MSAVFGAFNNDGVGLAIVFPKPGLDHDFKRASTGDDGNERNVRIANVFGKRKRQSRAGDDVIHPFLHRRPDDLLIIGERHHDIDSKRFFPVGKLSGLANFQSKVGIAFFNKVVFPALHIPDSNAGDRSVTAFPDGRGG